MRLHPPLWVYPRKLTTNFLTLIPFYKPVDMSFGSAVTPRTKILLFSGLEAGQCWPPDKGGHHHTSEPLLKPTHPKFRGRGPIPPGTGPSLEQLSTGNGQCREAKANVVGKTSFSRHWEVLPTMATIVGTCLEKPQHHAEDSLWGYS